MKLWIGSSPGAEHVSAPTGQSNWGIASGGVSTTQSPEAVHAWANVCSSISQWPASCVSVSPSEYFPTFPPGIDSSRMRMPSMKSRPLS